MGLWTWMSTWSLFPAMAALGALAVLSPIIIHLLNKRKFKIVDWAAMDFLLDADKRNRRRVRLENLILLLLRCAAMLLLGLMLALPFIPSHIATKLIGASQFEHIFVLDDSLSMQVQAGNQSPFEEAKLRLQRLIEEFATDRNDDTFTLILSSAPEQRIINGVRVNEASVNELTETIKALEPTDRAADLPKVLAGLEQELQALPENVARVLYVVTDLRRRDWHHDGDDVENDPAKALVRVAKALTGAYIVDVGAEEFKNIAITEIKPEGVLVAGVVSNFNVSVANYGSLEARDLTVKFKAGEALPQEAKIDRIAAGQTETVPFSFTFSGAETAGDDEDEDVKRPLDPVRVSVEVVSSRPAEEDRLQADSTALFPARVVRGIPTLIVDGDPNANEERSESFYLKHALSPHGPLLSGVDLEIVHESEMEQLSLSKYQVIFLCNVYQFSEKVRNDLEAWVKRGGGLIIMPGDQVDERYYNEHYFKGGQGLSPVRLDGILGDETEEKWVLFKVEDAEHKVLGVFEGQNNPALEMTKVFRWWGASAVKGQLGSIVDVPARFNDPEASIAMAEKAYGDGRVFFSAIPADADWHLWPIYGTYLISMEELVRYMGGDVAGSGSLRVGEPLVHSIELSDYKTDAELKLPRDKKVSLQAQEPGEKADEGKKAAKKGDKKDDKGVAEDKTDKSGDEKKANGKAQQTRWQLTYDDTSRRGFYEMLVSRNDGIDEKVLFAANSDPTEGNLTRVELPELRKTLGNSVKIVSGSSSGSLSATGAQREMWKYVLLAVVVVLAGEQLLAWAFGLRR